MPIAVESYSKLGAVVVQFPAAPPISIEPNDGLGGRNSHALQLQTAHHGHGNSGDGPIGGRSGTGSAIFHNPHLAAHVFRSAHMPVHFPTPNDSGVIGGRSGTGALTSHVHQAGRTGLLPAVQDNHHASNRTGHITLQPLLPQINAALQTAIPQAHHTLEAIGVGTDAHTLGILIGLLRTQGYHVTIASCESSVSTSLRTGFTGPTAILRGHGGAPIGQFLQQVASARVSHS